MRDSNDPPTPRSEIGTWQPRANIHMQWNHHDGPLMIRRDGRPKWLTLRERFMLWLGAWTLDQIEKRP